MKHGCRTDGLTRKAGEEENRNGKGAKQEGTEETEKEKMLTTDGYGR